MHESFNLTSPSPNLQHTARLLFSGEIRFGPPYYALSIDGYTFGERIFGGEHLWSPSSHLLAVQEWLTLDYSVGPITALVIIDAHLRREASVAQVTKGFIVPEAFEGTTMVYATTYAGRAAQASRLDTAQILDWKAFS